MESEGKPSAAVLALAALVFLSFLGSLGIFDPEEGRHASISVAMLRTGDFVIPRLQGFPYLEKPPLTYWMTAASLAALGRTELAARLPVALMGLMGTVAVFWLARERLGPRVAWIAAGLSVLTTQWFVEARYLTTDMVLAGWMTVALTAFLVAAIGGRRRLYWVFWIALSLATLAKGIVGFLLPGMIVGLFILLTGRWRLLREMHPVGGPLLTAALVLPWFLLVEARLPGFLRYFVVDQHLARYVSGTAEHGGPIWFFLPVVALGFFPWIAWLPFLGSGAGRRYAPDPREPARRGPAAAARPETVFLWVWFGVIFLFFSVSRGKLMSYLLPAYPPLAVLVAELFARLGDPARRAAAARGVRRGAWIAAGCYLLLAPLALVAVLSLLRRHGRIALDELGAWPWAFVALLALTGAALLVLNALGRTAAVLVTLATAHLLLYGVFLGAAVAADPFVSPGVLGRRLAEVVRPGDLVVLYEIQQPSMEFYLDRTPMLVHWIGEYEHGMRLEVHPDRVDPDPHAVRRLLREDGDVYVVAKNEDASLPAAFGAPVTIVGGNRKRTIYRNHPERP